MKIKNLLLVFTCIAAVSVGVQNFHQSISLASTNGNLSLNDFLMIAQADGEGGGSSCPGSKCSDANGNKYNYLETPSGGTCCGVAWISRGKKAT